MSQRSKSPAPRPPPRIYLVTPELAEAAEIESILTELLRAADVAAVLLRLAEADERSLINRIKKLAPIVQSSGAALLLDGYADLVARGGADGAHLTGAAAFASALERLKPERIVGIGGLTTRHDAMSSAEKGADYVMFGEPDREGKRPSFSAIEERIAWWAELFEVPCIGYAASLEEIAPLVAAGADFVAMGDFPWIRPEAAAEVISKAAALLRLPETVA
ncbi:MAG TPA: thiamine phosphate synthase [Pseudolabrys sp.]|nr:thiamine phosphate synthase [Pseudolabrys sp.]